MEEWKRGDAHEAGAMARPFNPQKIGACKQAAPLRLSHCLATLGQGRAGVCAPLCGRNSPLQARPPHTRSLRGCARSMLEKKTHCSLSLYLFRQHVRVAARLERPHMPPRCVMAQHFHVGQADEGFPGRALVARVAPTRRPARQPGLQAAHLGRHDRVLLCLGLAFPDGPDQGIKVAGVGAAVLGGGQGGGQGGGRRGHDD